MAHFNLDLDLDKSQAVGQVVRARVGDVESCVIEATIYDHGSEVDLAGMGARFCMLKPDRTVIEDDGCEVSGSTVTHTLGSQATAAAGVAKLAYFEILDGSTVIDSTQSFRLVVEPDAEGSGTGPSEDYISRVDAATEAANEAAEAATGAAQSATTAAGAAETATDAANDAADAANEAAQRADAAAELFPEGGEPGQLLSKTADGTAWVDPPSGNVLTGEAEGYVAHADDAYAQKPREVRIKGKTWVNRWQPINGSYSGITVSTDETGLITLSGTATSESTIGFGENTFALVPGKSYTVVASENVSDVVIVVNQRKSDATQAEAIVVTNTPKTFQANSEQSYTFCSMRVASGTTVNASFRVMLVDGTEAPDCFTPCASITSAQPEKLVTAGKNVLAASQGIEDLTPWTVSIIEDTDDGWISVSSSSSPGIQLNSVSQRFLVGETYTLSFEAYLDSGTADISYNYLVGVSTDPNAPNVVIGSIATNYSLAASTSPKTLHATFTIPDKVVKDGHLLIGSNQCSKFYVRNIQLELGSTPTAYEPPNVTTTPLPEVELRGLPNGTCDELVIKADGTCEVERKTVQITFDGSEDEVWVLVTADNGHGIANFRINSGSYATSKASIMCDTLPIDNTLQANATSAGILMGDTSLYLRLPSTTADTVEELKAWLEANPTTVVFTNSSIGGTEPQSPVTLPALPAPTFNQYHDSAVPSDTSTEYVRDINIAFSELQAQVSATTVREATNG